MDASTILTLVQTFLQVIDCSIYSEVESLLGYKSELDKLKATMSTIHAVLLNAEKQDKLQLPTTIPHITLERLQEAVYQADDLFDEVATVVQCKKKLMHGNKVVRLFFSRFNQLHYAFTKSREIRKIRGILDDIAKDHREFGSIHSVSFEVRNTYSRETHSFVCAEDVIIGRDDDKCVVIDMLLETCVEETVSVISIVGIGGLGKTTLAQLVYNDEMIVRRFPLRMWVCISDDFDVKVLLGQILAAATSQTDISSLSMDQLQRKLREELKRKTFLLVLDDIWNEDPSKWQELRKLLTQGGNGSRIVVTTRSRKVAYIVGSRQIHELGGLSDQHSWSLFERMTLEPGKLQLEADLIEIGKEIVRKCANVPLAIRVAGSLLQGNAEESWWQYLRNINLAHIKDDENGIVPVLKTSYHHLPTHLKSCFTYCAIFPKDYRIDKENLIHLWMAQGFILPLDGQSFEVLGEKYFMNLVQRCFFQDVIRDDKGGISSCKMHDLIHELAREVAGTGIKSSEDHPSSLNDKTRHFFTTKNRDIGHLTNMKNLRTILGSEKLSIIGWLPLKTASKMRYLRVLDLQGSGLKKLPSVSGELLHLRYLDLSCNGKLSLLPNSITQLYNLQTLRLRWCSSLKGLPRNLSNLVKLRHLDIQGCNTLRHMPPRMNTMTCLHKLTMFVVSRINRASGYRQVGDTSELGDLRNLNHLRGCMEIRIQRGWTYNASEIREGRYLINKPHLTEILISFNWERNNNDTSISEVDVDAEAMLQGLQPHYNLRMLKLEGYLGVSFPSWGDSSMNLKTSLPNLVNINLYKCHWLDHLPLLSQLRHLKVLELQDLRKLEYVESSSNSNKAPPLYQGSRREDELVFFPSLEVLRLVNLPELKRWQKTSLSSSSGSELESKEDGGVEIGDVHHKNNNKQQQQQVALPSYSIQFPHLSDLLIHECPKLKAFPLCLKLEKLTLMGFNRGLGPIVSQIWRSDGWPTSSPDCMNPYDDTPMTPLSTSTSMNRKKDLEEQSKGLREMKINDIEFLNSQPMESLQHLSFLDINNDTKIERLTTGEVGEVFRSGRLSSVRRLRFNRCTKLKNLTGRAVWEHFTALETLEFKHLNELELEQDVNITINGVRMVDGIDDHMPWRCLSRTLRSLELHGLPKLVKLPKGMQHLTALQSLSILYCWNLQELPPWIDSLSSLQNLFITMNYAVKSLPSEICHLKRLTRLSFMYCSTELVERCQVQTGADWHKIQHIPHIDIIN